jgi:tetratricopeptide (TPR) repeat protein
VGSLNGSAARLVSEQRSLAKGLLLFPAGDGPLQDCRRLDLAAHGSEQIRMPLACEPGVVRERMPHRPLRGPFVEGPREPDGPIDAPARRAATSWRKGFASSLDLDTQRSWLDHTGVYRVVSRRSWMGCTTMRSGTGCASLAALVGTGCTLLASVPPSDLDLLARAAETCRATVESVSRQSELPPKDSALVQQDCESVWTLRDRIPDESDFPIAYQLLLNAYVRVATLSHDPTDAEAALGRAIRIADDADASLTERSQLQASLANTYRERQPDRQEQLAQEALVLAGRSGDLFTIARRHRDLGRMYQHRGDLDQAEEAYTREIATYEELGRLAEAGDLPDNPRIQGGRARAQQIQRDVVRRNIALLLPDAQRERASVQRCRRYQAALSPEKAKLCCQGIAQMYASLWKECTLAEEKP